MRIAAQNLLASIGLRRDGLLNCEHARFGLIVVQSLDAKKTSDQGMKLEECLDEPTRSTGLATGCVGRMPFQPSQQPA